MYYQILNEMVIVSVINYQRRTVGVALFISGPKPECTHRPLINKSKWSKGQAGNKHLKNILTYFNINITLFYYVIDSAFTLRKKKSNQKIHSLPVSL